MAWSRGLFMALLFVSALQAGKLARADYPLENKIKTGDVLDVTARLKVTGNILVRSGGGKASALPLSVEGEFRYSERRLAEAAEDDDLRAVRYYRTAEADIRVDKQTSAPRLRRQVQLIATQGRVNGPMFFSPGGPLTREELDLLELPGDSLLIPSLLPAGPVAQGGTWNPSVEAIQAFTGLDVVGTSEVTCTLVEANDELAKVAFSGKVSGGVEGSQTDLVLEGHFLFDLKRGAATRLELAQKEKRSVGHVAPGLDVEAQVVVEIVPAEKPKELADDVLSAIPLEPNPAVVQLLFESADGKLRFYYDRDWHVFFSDRRVTVLRLVEKGNLVAQCNVSRMPSVAPGRHADPQRFQQDVIQALGEQFQRLIQAGEVPVQDGRWIYRLAAVGAAGKLPVQWIYYVVAGPSGDQAVFVYTMEAKMADSFGSRDLAMIGTVEFPAASSDPSPPQTAEKAQPLPKPR